MVVIMEKEEYEHNPSTLATYDIDVHNIHCVGRKVRGGEGIEETSGGVLVRNTMFVRNYRRSQRWYGGHTNK